MERGNDIMITLHGVVGEKVLVNVKYIACVLEHCMTDTEIDGTMIVFVGGGDNYVLVTDTIDEVIEMISQATLKCGGNINEI